MSVTGTTTAPAVLVASMRTRASSEVKPLTGTFKRTTKRSTPPETSVIGLASGTALSGWPSPFASRKSTGCRFQPPPRSVTVTEKLSVPLPVLVRVCAM